MTRVNSYSIWIKTKYVFPEWWNLQSTEPLGCTVYNIRTSKIISLGTIWNKRREYWRDKLQFAIVDKTEIMKKWSNSDWYILWFYWYKLVLAQFRH